MCLSVTFLKKERKNNMKKTLCLLSGLLYFAVYNTVYAQYFDVKQEMPRDYGIIAITNGIKLQGRYNFLRNDAPEMTKRIYYSTTTHREYRYPFFSTIDATNGDSLFSISPIPIDTNHVREVLYVDTLGSDFESVKFR